LTLICLPQSGHKFAELHKPTNFIIAVTSLMSELVLATIKLAWHHWKLALNLYKLLLST
jgi:hypothetical protein